MAFWLLGLVGVALLTAALAVLLAVRVPDSAPVAYSLVAHQAEEAGLGALPAPAPSPAATPTAATQGVREIDSGGGSVAEIGAGNSEAAAAAGQDTMGKQVPARRLVLKIVMSSSPSTGGVQDGSSLERAQGVVLQLETDGGAESSSASGNVPQLSGVDCKGHVQENKTGTQCGSAGAVDARRVQKNAGDEIQQEFVKVLGEIALQGSNVARFDSRLSEGSPKLRTVIINGVEIDEAGLQRLIASLPVTVSASEADDGRGKPVNTVPLSEVAQGVAETSLRGVVDGDEGSHVACAGVTQELQAKVVAGGPNAEVGLVAGVESEPSDLPESLQPLAVLDMPSDGLGYLRIIGAETIDDLKPPEDPAGRVSADVAAALAALNLDCMDVNESVMAGEHTSSSVPIPTVDGFVKKVPGNMDERSGLEPGTEGLDQRESTAASKSEGEEDDLEARRREKKKKKKKKQKAKSTKSMAATAAEIERKVIEKLTAEHVRALAEIEVGCSCKSRGASHLISCPYPFTSSGSMVQRKIKEQYDELVRSNAGRTLTLAQVGRFTTCLVEAKTALQQKSETIQRRFTIAKSLLAKADKSSFDRLCGQIYGLEIEQKKLEEDTVVYNRLQEQLKLSPAYQKMLEYGRTHFETQKGTGRLVEKQKPDNNDISFEELLAQEKKDSFWTKHSPGRASVPVV